MKIFNGNGSTTGSFPDGGNRISPEPAIVVSLYALLLQIQFNASQAYAIPRIFLLRVSSICNRSPLGNVMLGT